MTVAIAVIELDDAVENGVVIGREVATATAAVTDPGKDANGVKQTAIVAKEGKLTDANSAVKALEVSPDANVRQNERSNAVGLVTEANDARSHGKIAGAKRAAPNGEIRDETAPGTVAVLNGVQSVGSHAANRPATVEPSAGLKGALNAGMIIVKVAGTNVERIVARIAEILIGKGAAINEGLIVAGQIAVTPIEMVDEIDVKLDATIGPGIIVTPPGMVDAIIATAMARGAATDITVLSTTFSTTIEVTTR